MIPQNLTEGIWIIFNLDHKKCENYEKNNIKLE